MIISRKWDMRSCCYESQMFWCSGGLHLANVYPEASWYPNCPGCQGPWGTTLPRKFSHFDPVRRLQFHILCALSTSYFRQTPANSDFHRLGQPQMHIFSYQDLFIQGPHGDNQSTDWDAMDSRESAFGAAHRPVLSVGISAAQSGGME